MFTPTMSLPDDLMSSGTVLAISSTLLAFAAVVLVDGPALSVLDEHPETISAPLAATAAARRHIFPTDTSCLFFLRRAVVVPSSGGG
jgi:hypothetical protein